MFKKVITAIIVVTCILAIQCTSSKKVDTKYNNKILGIWERVGDDRAGLVVKVDQMSNQDIYIGTIIFKMKEVRNFEVNDIIWQNVEGVSQTQWRGNVMAKGRTLFGDTTSSTIEAKFLMINKDLLEVYVDNKTQKWVRSKEAIFNNGE